MRVIVRPPSESFRNALSEHPERSRLDPARALQQHAAFAAALEQEGFAVERLPPEADLADAPFVSDAVLSFPRGDDPEGPTELLVVTRPGAASRRPEVPSVAACARRLAGSRARVVEIREPGTLEGGDVLVYGRRVAIGLSARTNEEGARQLSEAVAPLGYKTFLCPVSGRLHLASAVTTLQPRRLIGTVAGFASLDAAGPDAAPPAEIERLCLRDEDVTAANVLALNGRCFMVAGFPRAAYALRRAGHRTVELELDEFTRADGGPTCLVALIH